MVMQNSGDCGDRRRGTAAAVATAGEGRFARLAVVGLLPPISFVGCVLVLFVVTTMMPTGHVEARPVSSELEAIANELRLRQHHDVALPVVGGSSSLLQSILLQTARRRRREANEARAESSTSSTPTNGTRSVRKGYGSNSYWNRSGWGGGYGK
jgi:hypothetical protein